jgi:hypothetical protein
MVPTMSLIFYLKLPRFLSRLSVIYSEVAKDVELVMFMTKPQLHFTDTSVKKFRGKDKS